LLMPASSATASIVRFCTPRATATLAAAAMIFAFVSRAIFISKKTILTGQYSQQPDRGLHRPTTLCHARQQGRPGFGGRRRLFGVLGIGGRLPSTLTASGRLRGAQ